MKRSGKTPLPELVSTEWDGLDWNAIWKHKASPGTKGILTKITPSEIHITITGGAYIGGVWYYTHNNFLTFWSHVE